MILFTKTAELQTLLNRLQKYFTEWCLRVNTKKTKICIFENRGSQQNQIWSYNERLEIVDYFCFLSMKVSKGAKIRHRYNQVPHLAQDTNGKVTKSQLDTTNESQEVSPFPAADHKAHINRCAQRHSKHKTEQKHKISTKEVPPWNGQ